MSINNNPLFVNDKNQTSLSESSTKTFLNKKRNISLLQRNYLIRRILSPIINDNNEYEKICNLYYLLMSFDWNDEVHSKNNLLQNIRGNSLWFYISAMYFPFVSNELVDNVSLLPDVINKCIIERHSTGKTPYKKNTPYHKKEKFNGDITSLLKDHPNPGQTSIEELMEIIQKNISTIDKLNSSNISQHIKKNFLLTNKYDGNSTYDEYLRMDMEYHSRLLNKFVDYIKTKNELRNLALDEVDPDDVVCVVCNDGDYEDDNLIVYCAVCHITVHQKCYGIEVVPKDDWICHSCLIYNNPTTCNSIECILCPVKGGAMKPCSVKKTSMLYSYLMSLRSSSNNPNGTNSNLSSGSKSYNGVKNLFTTVEETSTSTFSHNSTNCITNCSNNNGTPTPTTTNTSSSGNFISNSNEFINEKIANEHAWVHLSCALWIPEIIISNYDQKEKIKGIEGIGKKRFMERCEICLLKGYGPTIKCERCELRFHVECARVNKFQLESTVNQMGENKFHIFCQRHAPHKLVKARELKKQREVDDIKQFANIIEKNIEQYNKSHKNATLSVYNKSKGERAVLDLSASKIKLNNKEKKSFINAIRNLALEISQLNIEVNTKDYSLIPSTTINLRYIDLLTPAKFPWYMLKETEGYLAGMKPIEIFRIYKSIIPNEVEFNKVILRKGTRSNLNKKNKVITYCYCKKNDEAFMIGCEMGDKCPNNGWYHLECVEELKNLTRDDVQCEKFGLYYCPECRKINNLPSVNYNALFCKSSTEASVDNGTASVNNNTNNNKDNISNNVVNNDAIVI